jgi:hypothetical protein
MSQKAVKDNLVKYLDYKAKLLCQAVSSAGLSREISVQKQVAIKRHINDLKTYLNSEGKCFALSVAESAYSATGYGEWWREGLTLVNNWKGDEADFQKTISLESFLPKTHKPLKKSLAPTLESVFERVLNTASIEHAFQTKSVHDFLPEGLTQLNLLSPDTKFFEIVINNKIHNIQSRDVVGGYFPTQTLAAILEAHKELIEGNICVVHSGDHAINVKYVNNKWVLYDPNYKHNDVNSMTKSFDKAEDCVTEMKAFLRTESIALQLATLKEDKKMAFNFYDGLKPDAIIQLMQEDGLQVIAQRSPNQFKKIIDLAAKNTEVAKALAEGLVRANKYGWSGLLVVCRYAPLELENLIQLATENKIIAAAIAKAIPIANDHKWTALHMMISKASNALKPLLQLAEKNKKVGNAIRKTLDLGNEKNSTPRQMINKDFAKRALFMNFELKQTAFSDKGFYQASKIVDTSQEVKALHSTGTTCS